MKLFVCLVTPDSRLRRHFGRGKDGIIPKESLSRGSLADEQNKVTVATWTPVAPFSAGDLESFVLSRARHYDGCILIVDGSWRHYAVDIQNAAFIVTFEAAVAGDNLQNFFSAIFARAIRNFSQMRAKFRRGDDCKLLSLPLRNFQADDLATVARLCRELPLAGNLSNDVEVQLAKLRSRVRPRRKTNYNTQYAVDDVHRFFVYGLERHSQFATGDPHRPSCEMAGLFRFGIRLDSRRHYNVSETENDRTKIEGNFSDCHGAETLVTRKTHLNMFANDYF